MNTRCVWRHRHGLGNPALCGSACDTTDVTFDRQDDGNLTLFAHARRRAPGSF